MSFEITEEELNMLVIRIHDDDKTVLCWTALHVERLNKKGVRAVEMRDKEFKILKSTTLICKIEI